MTPITLEFLSMTGACADGRAWFAERPRLRGAEWPVVCAALDEDAKNDWSLWVRAALAERAVREEQ